MLSLDCLDKYWIRKTHMQRWEYLLVRVDLCVSGLLGTKWRPHVENGIEIPDWTKGLTEPDYLNRKGDEGWELVSFDSITIGAEVKYKSMCFKRPIS